MCETKRVDDGTPLLRSLFQVWVSINQGVDKSVPWVDTSMISRNSQIGFVRPSNGRMHGLKLSIIQGREEISIEGNNPNEALTTQHMHQYRCAVRVCSGALDLVRPDP